MAISTLVMFIASVVIQSVQASKTREAQRKAQEEADARADAQKGFQLVIDSEPIAIPVVYGRSLVGGSRVYHTTLTNYVFPADLDAQLDGRAIILKGNNPIIVNPPELPVVRYYFVAPSGFNPASIPNTVGANSEPLIMDLVVENSTNGGNDTGIGMGTDNGFGSDAANATQGGGDTSVGNMG